MVRAKDEWGKYGEDIAVAHLVSKGFVVLDRNWRCDIGEIDIVATEGDTLVICEVKTRTSDQFGTPLEGVSAEKCARLHRLAARWRSTHQIRARSVRVDIVGVLAGRGQPQIDHVRAVTA